MDREMQELITNVREQFFKLNRKERRNCYLELPREQYNLVKMHIEKLSEEEVPETLSIYNIPVLIIGDKVKVHTA